MVRNDQEDYTISPKWSQTEHYFPR